MKFSIITINFNNLFGLQKTVNSVLSQRRRDLIEYIIIDGASTDGSAGYLQTLPSEILWTSEKDRGISDAFNKGLRIATGDAILMLNSGDCFIDNNVIERVAREWEKYKVDILSYRVKVTDTIHIPSLDIDKSIYESCSMPHQGTFVAKMCYTEVGEYSEEYKIRMDYHFFARCRKHNYSFAYIPYDIVSYEAGGTSMALKNRLRFWKEGLAVKFIYNIKISIKDCIKFFLYLNRQ